MIMQLIGISIVIAVIGNFCFFVLNDYERGVLFRLGTYQGLLGPGLKFIIPGIYRLVRVDTRTITMDIPPQDVITRDNISIKVNAVLYFHVSDPAKAILKVENYLYATGQLAQTTLRSVCGEFEMDDLLSKRDEINHRLQTIVDKQSDPWGVQVTVVEVKHIDLPQEMQRAMAKQAEAEREKRAKIIQADGEYQAAEKLTQAAAIMSREGTALQLRYLETLRDIATEKNSTILFPVPIDFLEAFKKLVKN